MEYKSMYKYTTISFFLLIGLVKSSHAQEVWSLQKCITTAWQNSINIKLSENSIKNNAIDIKSAEQAKYPNASVGSNVFLNFGRSIDPTSNSFTTSTFFNNGLNLNTGVTLYNGGIIKNTLKSTQTTKQALQEDLEQMKSDIALNVASFYLNALFAKENISIATSNLALTTSSLTQIQTQIKLGAKAPNEALDIEAQLANDEQNILVAKNNFATAIMQLKQIMLVNEDFDVVAPENIAVSTDPELVTVDELYNAALMSQHGVNAEEWRVKNSDLSIKIAEGQKYPTIGLGGNLGTNYSNQGQSLKGVTQARQEQPIDITFPGFPKQEGVLGIITNVPVFEKTNYFKQFDNNLSYGVGFSINVPIYSNNKIKGGIQRAKLNKEVAILNLENKKQDLMVKVQSARNEAIAAKNKMVASQKALDANQLAYNNANKRFQLGGITSFDLMNARTRLDNAKNNQVISKYDYLFKIKIVEFYQGKPFSI